jgi:chromosome segregation ATPase
MIQSVMLVMLGFLTAGLLASLFAPALHRRAARLTTRRIESTMPLTLSEIEADKDQLRAGYAVKVRRLESALARSKDKSAGQLVEISRLHMAIAAIQDQSAEMERKLEERRNAAAVFEQTIRKRFPELEVALAQAKTALEEQAYEISDLRNKLRQREDAVSASEGALLLSRAEVKQLREAMERSGSEYSGRFAKRASQWSLEEYRAEYDRLNIELSKMREYLGVAEDRELNQTVALKSELQQLAQQIMTMSEQARRAQGGGADGVHPTDRTTQRRQAERRAPPAAQQQHRAPVWPKHGAGSHGAKPVVSEPPAAKQQAVFEGEEGDKSGEPGIRTLLDRLRDIPEPLTGS